MTNETIDPREIPALCERIGATLPALATAILAACEADAAFAARCREMGVEGGVMAAFEAAREAARKPPEADKPVAEVALAEALLT